MLIRPRTSSRRRASVPTILDDLSAFTAYRSALAGAALLTEIIAAVRPATAPHSHAARAGPDSGPEPVVPVMSIASFIVMPPGRGLRTDEFRPSSDRTGDRRAACVVGAWLYTRLSGAARAAGHRARC